MSFRTDPALIDRLAGVVQDSTTGLNGAAPAPGADAGPSTAAVAETVAELMRAAAGLAEMTAKMTDDLHANKTTYASTDDANTGLFGQLSR